MFNNLITNHNVNDILSGFQKTIERLELAATYHYLKREDIQVKITDLTNQAKDAVEEGRRAVNISSKLKALLASD